MGETNKPKGILKPSHPDPQYNQHGEINAAKIRWDEDNLMITEAQKDSKMKITEPKTPYIHYDMNRDEIVGHTGEIPPMELTSALESIAAAQQQQSLASLSSSSSFMQTSDSEDTGRFPPLSSSGSNAMMPDVELGHSTVAAQKSETSNNNQDWDEDEDDDVTRGMTEEEKQKHLKFEKLRSQHYNMKMVLAEARRKLEEEEDDEANNDDVLEVEDYEDDEEEEEDEENEDEEKSNDEGNQQ